MASKQKKAKSPPPEDVGSAGVSPCEARLDGVWQAGPVTGDLARVAGGNRGGGQLPVQRVSVRGIQRVNVKSKIRRNLKPSPEDVGGAVRSSEDSIKAGVRAEGVAGAGELGGEGDLGPGRGRGARGRLGHSNPVQSLGSINGKIIVKNFWLPLLEKCLGLRNAYNLLSPGWPGYRPGPV